SVRPMFSITPVKTAVPQIARMLNARRKLIACSFVGEPSASSCCPALAVLRVGEVLIHLPQDCESGVDPVLGKPRHHVERPGSLALRRLLEHGGALPGEDHERRTPVM